MYIYCIVYAATFCKHILGKDFNDYIFKVHLGPSYGMHPDKEIFYGENFTNSKAVESLQSAEFTYVYIHLYVVYDFNLVVRRIL